MQYYGYIYEIRIPTSEGYRYYYGKKKSRNKIAKNYWGSGVKLRKWINAKTQGKVNYTSSMSCKIAEELGLKRRIIFYAKDELELNKLEEQIVAKHLGKEYCWNLCPGGTNSATYGHLGKSFSEESKQKIRNKLKGRKLSREHIEKISKGRMGIPSPKGMLGKKQKKESIEKAIQTKKERGTNRLSKSTIEKIKQSKQFISEETRQKMSEGQKRREHFPLSNTHKQKISDTHKGNKNPAYGKKWWNNGVLEMLAYTCPDKDWIRGRLKNKS